MVDDHAAPTPGDRMPHPLVLLLTGVLLAMVLTWVLPAGLYERQADADTGRELVLPGTWHRVTANPVGPMQAILAVPRGIVNGADVVVVILFVGGAFALLDRTGALRRLVMALVGRTRRPRLVVVSMSLVFGTLGALDNTFEEIIALIPVLLVLSRGLGFGPVTALAMSVGAATVGGAFGPTNPFASGIANRFAGLPLGAGAGVRLGLTIVTVSVWIAWTLSQVSRDPVTDEPPTDSRSTGVPPAAETATARDGWLLAMAVVPFAPYMVGVLHFDWGFDEIPAIFLVVGLAIGLLSGLGLRGSAEAYLRATEPMLTAALFVGIARAISVVLTDGQVIDTLVHGLSRPLEGLSPMLAATLMVPVHMLLHVVVPSVSGHAALTMPIMGPLADLLRLPRELAVMAYQTGGPIMDILSPTSGPLLAMLMAARVSLWRWIHFAVPGALLVIAVGIVGMQFAR